MKIKKLHNKLKDFFKTNKLLKIVLMLAVIGLVVGITASIRSALAFESYELGENNVLELKVLQKKASSTATIRYQTGAWYIFPRTIDGAEQTYSNLSDWTALGGEKLPLTDANLRKPKQTPDAYGVYRDIYDVPEEVIVPIVLEWYKNSDGSYNRDALISGVEVFASRTLQVVKNGSVTGTYYCADGIINAVDGWSGGAIKAFEESYDHELFLQFHSLPFDIEIVDTSGIPIDFTYPYDYDGKRLYGEKLESFSYPGVITGYSYQGYELIKEYIIGGSEKVKEGSATATSTGTYNGLKLQKERADKPDLVGEYKLILRFKYAKNDDVFVPTDTPTPTISVTPTPTTAPPVTVEPTVAPTPGPDEIVIGNYCHYFTTDLGHSMYSVINDTDYIVATHSGSGYDGTLLSAKAITRTKSYYTGTDSSGNTWYFIPDGTEATFVHPAIYNGHNVNTENIKNITELVFPSTITRGSTTYTVTHIGGGTEKYHVIEDNSDSSSDTTSYDYDPHYGYYSYHKEGGTTNIPTLIYSDQKYAFGVLGNGYIETNGYNDKTNNTTGYYECTDIYRNYYVYNTTLRSITIPDTVKYIEDYAFLYCQNLSEIKGGNGLIRIGVQAFGAEESIPLNHCMNYTNISEDTDGTQINNTQIEYHEYNLDTKWVTYVTEGGVSHTACNDGDEHRYCTQINEPNTEMLLHTKKVINLTKNKLELPVFPVLTTIQQQAFNYRANLWEVKLNSTVNSIGWGAFNGCYLDSIEIPSTSLSILSSGSTNQVKKPDYETLGTNKAGESRTIILSNPGTPAVKYGRTYPDYYRLKAGYTITYHSNNGMNETVQQISDMEYLVADYVYTIGDYAVESNGNVIKLTANYDNTITITQVGTMPGGVQKVLYQGTLTDYETQYDSGTTTSSVPLSVDATYLRGADGSVWRYVYDTTHAYGLEKLDIPAGTEVYFFNGFPYYLSSDGYVMTVKLQAFDNSYNRNKSVTTSSKFGYTDYSDTTTYDYRFNSYSSVKANVLEQRGERIVMQRSSDSTWHFLDRVDYLDRDNDGNIIYESWLDSEGNVRQDITFSKMSGVSGEPVAVKIDNEYTGRSYIITKNGLAYRKYSNYDNIYAFRTMSYSGSISLTSIFGGEYGVIYDTSNQIISIKLESNKPVLTATGIYGPIKEAYPTDSGNYYYLTESGALCYYDSSTYTYTSILPGAKFTKVQVESIGAYALTDGGDVYDITTPTSPSVYIGGYGAKDFLFFPGSTYYRKMYVITSDGTLVGKGYKLYKGSNSEYVDSTSNVIQIPNIVEAQKITELSNNRFAVYTEEGVYVETNGVWNFHIVDKGCNFTAELWGTNWKNPGKKFADKWNTNAAGTGTSYAAGQLISLTSNLVLYAQWEASSDAPRIKYHPNGGSGGMADTVLSNGVTSATLSKFGFSAPDGYVKKEPYCWNTSPNGTGTSYTDGATVTGITTDLTLYAQWLPTSSLAGQYTLVYWKYPYGTDNNSVWKTKTLSFGQTEVIEGTPVSPTDTTYTVTYVLNKPSEMTEAHVEYTLTDENTKAYAKTSFNNRWRLYKTGSSDLIATGTYYNTGRSVHDLTMVSGETLNLFPEMKDESRAEVYLPYTDGEEYWRFLGWCENADGTGTIYAPAPPEGDEVAVYRPTKNVTLYGIWNNTRTVSDVLLDINSLYTYDAGTLAQSGLIDNFNLMTGTFDFYVNGVCVADDVNDWAGWLTTIDSYEIKDIKPVVGYVIDGADTTYVTDGITGIGLSGTLNDAGSLAGNARIWLKAAPVSFTLSYDAQGGTMPAGAPASYTMSYHQSWNHTIHIPDRTGYVFNGWYSAPVLSDGVQMFDKTGVQSINNVHWATTLNGISSDKGVWLIGDCITYAQWTPKTTTVTLDQQGATTSGTTSVVATYDANMPVPITLPKREYTVTYNANGGTCGTVSNSASYTFGGYHSAVNGSGTQYYKADGTSARTWNVDAPTATLYAKWASNTVTLPTPSRTGYTFAGWYTAASGGDSAGAAGASYTPSTDITLYAHWTANNRTLTIDGNKGGGTSAVTVPYSSVTLTFDSTNHYYNGSNHSNYLAGNLATRDGYDFTGYYTAPTGGIQLYTSTGAIANGGTIFYSGYVTGYYFYQNLFKVDSNITVYAQWKAKNYTLTLNPNGGVLGSGDSSPYTMTFDTANYSDISWGLPTRVGYTFTGWWTAASGGIQVYKADGKFIGEGTYFSSTGAWIYPNDITLYAQWTPNPYTLEYDLIGNKLTASTNPSINPVPPTNTVYDTTFTVANPKRTGYTFQGWDISGMDDVCTHYYDSNPTTAKILTGIKATNFKNLRSTDGVVKFKAQWKNNTYTVTLNTNAIGANPAAKLNYGSFTIDFDTAGHIYGGSTKTNYLVSNIPTRTGYTFNGWYTAATGGTKVYNADGTITKDGIYFDADGEWVYPNNVTFYAHWTANSYQITINENKGTGSSNVTLKYPNVILTFDSSNHKYNNVDHNNYLAGNTSSRPGYTFQGYFTAATGGIQLYTNLGTIAGSGTVAFPGYESGYYFYQNLYKYASDMTIYAQWKPITYTVNLNLNDPGAIPAAKIDYNSFTIVFDTPGHTYGGNTKTDYLSSNLPSRVGYTFNGWYTAASGGTKVYNADGSIVKEGVYFDSTGRYVYPDNVTLYAHWTANKYTLTLDGNKGTGTTAVSVPYVSVITTYDSINHRYNNADHSNYLAENLATRIGYTFQGYFTQPSGGIKLYNADGSLIAQTVEDAGYVASLSGYYFHTGKWKVANNITLYAQWIPNKYNVVFDARGGRFDYGGSKLLSDMTVHEYADIYDNTTNYPKEFTYTFTFDDKIVNAIRTKADGSTTTAIAIPVKTGYKFGGFYTGIKGQGVKVYDATGTYCYSAMDAFNYLGTAGGFKWADITRLYAYWIPSENDADTESNPYVYPEKEYAAAPEELAPVSGKISVDMSFDVRDKEENYEVAEYIPTTESLEMIGSIASHMLLYQFEADMDRTPSTFIYNVTVPCTIQYVNASTEELVITKTTTVKEVELQSYATQYTLSKFALFELDNLCIDNKNVLEEVKFTVENTTPVSCEQIVDTTSVIDGDVYVYTCGNITIYVYEDHASTENYAKDIHADSLYNAKPEYNNGYFIATTATGAPQSGTGLAIKDCTFDGISYDELLNIIANNTGIFIGGTTKSDTITVQTPDGTVFIGSDKNSVSAGEYFNEADISITDNEAVFPLKIKALNGTYELEYVAEYKAITDFAAYDTSDDDVTAKNLYKVKFNSLKSQVLAPSNTLFQGMTSSNHISYEIKDDFSGIIAVQKDGDLIKVHTPVASNSVNFNIDLTNLYTEITISPDNMYQGTNYLYSKSQKLLLNKKMGNYITNNVLSAPDNTVTFPFDVWDKESGKFYGAGTSITLGLSYNEDGTPVTGNTFLIPASIKTDKYTYATASVAVNAPDDILALNNLFVKSSNTLYRNELIASYFASKANCDAGILNPGESINDKYIAYSAASIQLNSALSNDRLVVSGEAIDDMYENGLDYMYMGEIVDYWLDTSGAFADDNCKVEITPKYTVDGNPIDMYYGFVYKAAFGLISPLVKVGEDSTETIRYVSNPTDYERELREELLDPAHSIEENFWQIRTQSFMELTSMARFFRDIRPEINPDLESLMGKQGYKDNNKDGISDVLQKSQARWRGQFNVQPDTIFVDPDMKIGYCSSCKDHHCSVTGKCSICGNQMSEVKAFDLREYETFLVYTENHTDFYTTEGYLTVTFDVKVTDCNGKVLVRENIPVYTDRGDEIILKYKIGTKAGDKWELSYGD